MTITPCSSNASEGLFDQGIARSDVHRPTNRHLDPRGDQLFNALS